MTRTLRQKSTRRMRSNKKSTRRFRRKIKGGIDIRKTAIAAIAGLTATNAMATKAGVTLTTANGEIIRGNGSGRGTRGIAIFNNIDSDNLPEELKQKLKKVNSYEKSIRFDDICNYLQQEPNARFDTHWMNEFTCESK